MIYETKLLTDSEADIKAAAELIRSGNVVGMPTETVYGLAADATDPEAAARIYSAKGRPSDNPLIVHIAAAADMEKYAENIPPAAYRLAELFWPGPLTMVLKKKSIIPNAVSGGLDTVGLRFPVHRAAQALIRAAGVPLAAPSANLSGSPSPTSAQHVMKDMKGRIPAIIDGGECPVGVESTVLCFEGGAVKILRPGFVTGEEIAGSGFEVTYARGITEELQAGERALSPGMKYKHYSPKANVTLVEGGDEEFLRFAHTHCGDDTYFVIYEGEFPYPCRVYGSDPYEQARRLFPILREMDDISARQVYIRCPQKTGMGLAVYNRLLRAAAFEVILL